MQASSHSSADECLRCGYSLLGIANDQPCPECGLVASASRRLTGDLHETRPQWLRSLWRGVLLLILAILMAGFTPFYERPMYNWTYALARRMGYSWPTLMWVQAMVPVVWMSVMGALFLAGVLLLSVRERYEPADREDRLLRKFLRIAALATLLALALVQYQSWVDFRYPRYMMANPSAWQPAELAAMAFGLSGVVPMPLLLFSRLQGLAQRARSAHLAEHCMIVGIGTTFAVVYAIAAWVALAHGNEWFGDYWMERSKSVIYVMLGTALPACLFGLWSLYLLARFGWAFGKASRELKRKWDAADRSQVSASPIPAGFR